MTTILAFLLAIVLLVAVHEWGHFWVARRLGVKVLRFSIGFGRPFWHKRLSDGCEFVLSSIPLGGYVRMLDENEGPVDAAEQHRAFNRQSLAVRSAVVLAGPVMNLIFAVLLYWLLALHGSDQLRPFLAEPKAGSPAAEAGIQTGDQVLSVNGGAVPSWSAMMTAVMRGELAGEGIALQVQHDSGVRQSLHLLTPNADWEPSKQDLGARYGLNPMQPVLAAVVGKLTPGGAAEQAGLQAGDRIISWNGVAVSDWLDWVQRVRAAPGKPAELALQRHGQHLSLQLTPDTVHEQDQDIGRVGVLPQIPKDYRQHWFVHVEYGVLAALGVGLQKTWDVSWMTLKVMGRIITGHASVKNLSGPLTIAQYAGESAGISWQAYLSFLGLISISLGVLNLLPIPMLDGGHLFFYAIEAVYRRPLPEMVLAIGQRLGMALLMLMISIALFNDIQRLFT